MTTPAQRKINRKNLEKFLNEEMWFLESDYFLEITKFSEYHYKIKSNEVFNSTEIEVWPSTKKYRNTHNKADHSEEYEDLTEIIKKEFNIK